MVFDCFTFFNELDLLEFRLKLLDGVVDKFVICESNYTHSGNKKLYNYQDNKERYSQWENKILYLPIDQSIEGLNFDKVNNYTPTNGSWILENEQRSALLYAGELMGEKDIVLVGDLDEIPDPRAITALKQKDVILNDMNNALSFSMLFHYYYMNCQMEGYDRIWNGTVVCFADYFKERGPQYFRDNRNNFAKIPNSGYHFSYLGGPKKSKSKDRIFCTYRV